MYFHAHNDKKNSGSNQAGNGRRRNLHSERGVPGTVISLREGKQSDHEALVRLVIFSAPSFLSTLFGSHVEELLKYLIQQEKNLYSYRHSLVAETHGILAGVALGYNRNTMHKEWYLTGIHIARCLGLSFPPFLFRLIRFHRSFAPLHETDWYVSHLAVAPHLRRQGTGEALINRVSQRACQQGLERITLDVEAENQSALKFYHRLGFLQEKESPPAKFGGHTFHFLRLYRNLKP